jgi:ferric-dicitrate binding protein FerR (iron transport regulator)
VSNTHDEIRALRVMVDELRAEKPPEIAWDAVEASLLARLDAPAPGRPGVVPLAPRPRSALPQILGFAAAAALLALGVSSIAGSGELRSATAVPDRPVDVATVPIAAGERAQHDLRALAVGDTIEAKGEAVSFGRAGVVSWTLAPGSMVRVRSMGTAGVGHTVALERGSIRAEVTPRDPAEGLVEAFAVEVAGTRVAVHGTAFSVAREDGRAVVDVEHGAVAVGPVGHVGATTGHLLVGPSRAAFSLDGGRTSRLLAPAAQPVAGAPVPVAAASVPDGKLPAHGAVVDGDDKPAVHDAVAAAVPAPRLGQASHPAAKPAAEAPAVIPPAPASLTADVVRSRLTQCFKRTSETGSAALQISVSSTLRLNLNDDGTVLLARFDPPLKPEYQVCAGVVFGGRFAESGHLDIPVSFKP